MLRVNAARPSSRRKGAGMSKISRCLKLTILALAVAGCQEATERGAPPDDAADAAAVSVSDSAGVRIVQISDVHALSLPRLETRLLYSTAADLLLAHVVGAVFLPDSSLVLADDGATEIIFLDPDGRVRARTGREGEGPGEYVDISRIGVGADGTPYAYDRRHRRFTVMDSNGSVTGVQDIEPIGEVVPLARLAAGEVLGVFEPRPLLPAGLHRPPLLLLLADRAWENVDTVGSWAGKERIADEGRWNPVAFGSTALYSGRGPHVVMATTDSLDLSLYYGSTLVTRIRGGSSPREITAGEMAAWTDLFLGMYPEERHPTERRRLQSSTVRSTYPAFQALGVDADGGIWLGDYAKHEEQERRWTVFGSDGRPIGSVNLPVFRPEWVQLRAGAMTGYGWVEFETTIPSAEHELLDVMGDRIAILRRDDLEGEFVEVYEVSRAATP